MGLGVLPTNCTQLALLGNYRNFGIQDQFEGDIPVDGVKGADTYIASLMVRHFFGKGWSAEILVPTGTIKVETQEGDPIFLSGFGDIDLAGAYDFAALWGAGGFRPSLELSLGLGLPTGTQAIVDNTEGLFPPNLLALGYGAFSMKTGLTYTQSIHRMLAVKLFGLFRLPLSWSEQNLKYGSTLSYGLGLLFHPINWLSVIAQATGLHMEPNESRSMGLLDSSGGDIFAAELAVSTSFMQRIAFGVGGRIPFYASLHNTETSHQLEETFSVSIFFALMFSGDEEEEEIE